MMTVHIDLRRDLWKVREAYNKGELQAQKVEAMDLEAEDRLRFKCLYTGPCGVGAMVPEAERERLDNGIDGNGLKLTAISSLVRAEAVTIPAGQSEDLSQLQADHDSWLQFGNKDRFLKTLAKLEAKYGDARE